jgi:hypothetical protein
LVSGTETDDEDWGWPDRRRAGFRWLVMLAVLVSIISLFALYWWPNGYPEATMIGFRNAALADPYQYGLPGFTLAYLDWGCFVQLVGLLLFAAAVFGPQRWWLPGAALAVLTTIWQLAAMLFGELLNLMVTAWLCPISIGVLLVCWLAMRPQRAPADRAGQ